MRYFNRTVSVNDDKTKLLTANEVLQSKEYNNRYRSKLIFQRITSSMKHQNLQNAEIQKTHNQKGKMIHRTVEGFQERNINNFSRHCVY